jgi:hypothetical protein
MTAPAARQFNHASLTAWNLLFNYANSAVLMLCGLVLTPIYLGSIPETTFGVWLATGNLVAWLSLVDPGLNAVVQQRIAAAYASGDNLAVGRLRTCCRSCWHWRSRPSGLRRRPGSRGS